jgi:hypothetical protein
MPGWAFGEWALSGRSVASCTDTERWRGQASPLTVGWRRAIVLRPPPTPQKPKRCPTDRMHDVPLGRGRQRNFQMPLETIAAIEWLSAAVFHEPDHATGRGIVLRLPTSSGAATGRRRSPVVALPAIGFATQRRPRGSRCHPLRPRLRFWSTGRYPGQPRKARAVGLSNLQPVAPSLWRGTRATQV